MRLGKGAVVRRAAGLLQPSAVGRLDSDVSRWDAHHVLLVVGLARSRSCWRHLKQGTVDDVIGSAIEEPSISSILVGFVPILKILSGS